MNLNTLVSYSTMHYKRTPEYINPFIAFILVRLDVGTGFPLEIVHHDVP